MKETNNVLVSKLVSDKNKRALEKSGALAISGAEGGTRTRMLSPTLDFESSVFILCFNLGNGFKHEVWCIF